MSTRKLATRVHRCNAIVFRDDAGCKHVELYRRLSEALERGQSLAGYGLAVYLVVRPGARPVRCVA